VLDWFCGVVEAGSFSRVSGVSMHVTLVGILRGKLFTVLVFCFCFIVVVCCASMVIGEVLVRQCYL
jgi:hypothetical protein